MKFTLTEHDLDHIECIRAGNPVCNFLDQQINSRFSIGDILIRHTKGWDDEDPWETELVNHTTGVAKRYVYVYEDKHGVGFLKRLKITDGTLGIETFCITEMIGPHSRFKVDPDFEDSILFGDGSFDIKAIRKAGKAKKDKIVKFNKASLAKSNSLLAVNNFFAQLKAGDTFYSGNVDGSYILDYKIISITKKYISQMSDDDKESLEYEVVERLVYDLPENKCNYSYIINYDQDWRKNERDGVWEWINDELWLNKPLTIKDSIE